MSTTPTQVRPGMTSYGTNEGGPRFLSDVIIELGLAQEEHVNRAVQDARLSRANVGQILVQEGRLTEDDLARALAARYGLSHIDMTEFEVDPDAANLLPPNVAQRYRAVPLAFEPDGSLLVAMADPSDSLALSDITFMTHLDVQASVAAANRDRGAGGAAAAGAEGVRWRRAAGHRARGPRRGARGSGRTCCRGGGGGARAGPGTRRRGRHRRARPASSRARRGEFVAWRGECSA